MHGLRAENHAKTTSVEGLSSIRTACETKFSTGNRRTYWKFHELFC